MQLLFNYYLIMGITLLSSLTTQLTVDILPPTLFRNVSDSKWNSSIKSSVNEVPRNKRAVGLLLQGLVQALGYNVTPIQIAILPNGNNVAGSPTDPLNINTKQLNQSSVKIENPEVTPRPTSSSSNSNQRDTLRFTGVVNFGNNSDILSHLRQYEILFHGTSTISPVASTPLSTRTPNVTLHSPPSQTISFLTPILKVPIDIPLIEDLRYPKPLLSVVTITPNNINSTSNIPQQAQNHPIPNIPIKNEQSYEDDDEEEDSDEKTSYEDKNTHEENYGSEEYNNNNNNDDNDDDDDDDDNRTVQEPKKNDTIENEGMNDERDTGVVTKYTKDYNGAIKFNRLPSRGNTKFKDSHAPNRDEESFEDFQKFIPNKYSGDSGGLKIKLPIDDTPFKGKLMNSYGQSLEHSGKIDETIADYFGKYKNPQSGVYEPLISNISKNDRRKPLSINRINAQQPSSTLPQRTLSNRENEKTLDENVLYKIEKLPTINLYKFNPYYKPTHYKHNEDVKFHIVPVLSNNHDDYVHTNQRSTASSV